MKKRNDRNAWKQAGKNRRKYTGDNTIYDDVFQTMRAKMPQLMIPLINETFHTCYQQDEALQFFPNEHPAPAGKRITDLALQLGMKRYHIECESRPDGTMAVRFVEYDFSTALEHVQKHNGCYELCFPKSCAVYLRHTKNTPQMLKIRLAAEDPNGMQKDLWLKIPVIKVKNYTLEEIFEKNLLVFLPYYIMRYEDTAHETAKDPAARTKLEDEYRRIRIKLECAFSAKGNSIYYSYMKELTMRVVNYTLKEEKELIERIGEIMGGTVIDLPEIDNAYMAGERKGKTEAIIELLKETGDVSPELSERIMQENDVQTLHRWLKAAARANSVGQFEKMM